MKRINVAKILRDCPNGMELDCTCADNVIFDKIIEYEQIKCVIGECHDPLILDKYGRLLHICCPKCIIFPKGKTTWEGFVPPCKFKAGDVVVNDSGAIFLYKQIHTYYKEKCADFYCGLFPKSRSFIIKTKDSRHCGEISSIRFATEKEKAELFKAIKDNGYHWNDETKTLIKPMFKINNIIRHKERKSNTRIVDIKDGNYIFENGDIMPIHLQNDYEFITDKFDINKLKPFDKVLVRDTKEQVWVADLFSHMVNRSLGGYTFACVGHYPNQCIPYEGNEHLLGTTNDCDEYFNLIS